MNIYIEVVQEYQNEHKDDSTVWNICTTLLKRMEEADKQIRSLRAVRYHLNKLEQSFVMATDDIYQPQEVLRTGEELLRILRYSGFLPEGQ